MLLLKIVSIQISYHSPGFIFSCHGTDKLMEVLGVFHNTIYHRTQLFSSVAMLQTLTPNFFAGIHTLEKGDRYSCFVCFLASTSICPTIRIFIVNCSLTLSFLWVLLDDGNECLLLIRMCILMKWIIVLSQGFRLLHDGPTNGFLSAHCHVHVGCINAFRFYSFMWGLWFIPTWFLWLDT